MLKTVLKNTTENGMIKENSQIKEKISISSEKNLTKKQEDLGLLTELRKNIKDFKQENMKSSLCFIGKKLHSINWDKNDLSCVRNKHGYRNRDVNKGNQETVKELSDFIKEEFCFKAELNFLRFNGTGSSLDSIIFS